MQRCSCSVAESKCFTITKNRYDYLSVWRISFLFLIWIIWQPLEWMKTVTFYSFFNPYRISVFSVFYLYKSSLSSGQFFQMSSMLIHEVCDICLCKIASLSQLAPPAKWCGQSANCKQLEYNFEGCIIKLSTH